MPNKILTLLIFTILFPCLIAGSTLLVLKSGLAHIPEHKIENKAGNIEKVEMGKKTEMVGDVDQMGNTGPIVSYISDECGLEIKYAEYKPYTTTKKVNLNLVKNKNQKFSLDSEENPNRFIIYKCDPKIPQSYVDKTKSSSFNYQKIENVEEFEQTLPTKNKLKWSKAFFQEIKEMYFLTSKSGASSPQVLNWEFVAKNGLYYDMTFSSVPSEESMVISDLKFSSFKNQNYTLVGNCDAYVEKNEPIDCVLVDRVSQKTIFNFDKDIKLEDWENIYFGNANWKHGGNLVDLGKQESNHLYILLYFPSAGFSFSGMGTMGELLSVYKLNLNTKKLTKKVRGARKFSAFGCFDIPHSQCDPDCVDIDKEEAYQQKCFDGNELTDENIDWIKGMNLSFNEIEKTYQSHAHKAKY